MLIESAVCLVTGVDNGKHCVFLKNPKSSTIPDYSFDLMYVLKLEKNSLT